MKKITGETSSDWKSFAEISRKSRKVRAIIA